MMHKSKSPRRRILPHKAEEELESELQSFIGGRDLAFYRMMEYQMGWDDNADAEAHIHQPRQHGTLMLAATKAICNDHAPALKYAVSLELINSFAAIHADVQDGNTERMGRPSIWWKWGPSQAINAGDGMHALARLSLFRLHEESEPIGRISKALAIVDAATLKMCEGEYLDVLYQERPQVSVEEYIDMAARRVGALYGAATEMSTIFSNESHAQAEAMRSFGIGIGIMKQIASDFSSFFSEQQQRDPVQQGRIIAKKKSLPLAFLFDNVDDPGLRRRVGEIYLQRVIDPAQIAELSQLAEDAGAKDFMLKKMEAMRAEAKATLHQAGISADHIPGMLDLARQISDTHSILSR